MSISKDIIVDALRVRYDAYSAETVFELTCQRAELEGKTAFDGRELAAFRKALEKVGDRVGGVLVRLDDLLGGAPEAKDASDSKPNKSDSKPNEQVADAKSDGKGAKKDEPIEAKPEAKPDAKPQA